VEYDQRKSGRTVSHFRFGLKNQKQAGFCDKKTITEQDIQQQARPGETRTAVLARLSGVALGDFAKPGETFDQALKRKRDLAEIKKILGRVR